MKTRTGFVSNSSSSSFLIKIKNTELIKSNGRILLDITTSCRKIDKDELTTEIESNFDDGDYNGEYYGDLPLSNIDRGRDAGDILIDAFNDLEHTYYVAQLDNNTSNLVYNSGSDIDIIASNEY